MENKRQRGTAIIEYVIILAFICGIGASFTSDGLSKPINSIIGKVAAILDLDFDNGGGNLLAGKSEGAAKKTFINGELQDWGNKIGIFESQNEDGSCNLIELKPDTTYEITFDFEKMKTDYELKMDQEANLGIFIWGESTTGKAPILDSRDMGTERSYVYNFEEHEMRGSGDYRNTSITATLSDDGKSITYTFKTQNTPSYLGIALDYPSLNQRDEKMPILAQNYQNFLTLREAPK